MGVLIARHIAHAQRAQSNLKVVAMVAVVGIAIAGWPAGELRAIWDGLCVLVIFPLVVWWGTLIDPGPQLRRTATFLGLTSYAVYVLHSPLSYIWNSATRRFADTDGRVGAPFTGMTVLALLLIGCWLVDRYFDVPIRSHLNRFIPRSAPSARGPAIPS